MTPGELSEDLRDFLESISKKTKSEIKVTRVFEDDGGFVMRAMIPENDKIRVIQINVKELCLYKGLSTISVNPY